MQTINIGMENGDEDRSLAWVLDHPGCFAYGVDRGTALAAVPRAVLAYSEWVQAHGGPPWIEDDFKVRLAETWNVFCMDDQYDVVPEGYVVNAWFHHDWKPLKTDDVQRGVMLLSWSREDLLDVAQGLDQEVLERRYPGERWSIAGILGHVGKAEWWYLTRLGLAPEGEEPTDPFARMDLVRAHLINVLPSLVDATLVRGVDGEFWSPRKLLRRAVWHERDHTGHILKLISA